MGLIDWQEVRTIATLLAFLIAAVWLFFASASRKPAVRIPLRVLAVVVMLLALPLLAITGLARSCNTPLTPVYSPDRTAVAQVNRYDAGATGGGDYVAVHWAHGMRMQVVFSSGWETVEPQDLHWIDDHTLQIDYEGRDKPVFCQNSPTVIVICHPGK